MSEGAQNLQFASDRFEVVEDPVNKYIVMNPLDPETKKPMEPTHSFIYLHGLTSTAEKYFNRFNEDLDVPEGFRIIIPQAPRRPTTCMKGSK